MKIMRLLFILSLVSFLSACGVDKFFIERAVDKFDTDIVNGLEEFATLTAEQEEHAKIIASLSQRWIKHETLPKVADLIEQVAIDVETEGALTQAHYDEAVAFFYRPIPLSDNDELLGEVAKFFFEMSPEQDSEVRETLIDNYEERKAKRDERSFEEEKDRIASTLKIIFRGMGVSRSRDELKAMRAILETRIDLSAQTNDYYLKVNRLFVASTENKGDSPDQFKQRYKAAWQALEAGPNSAHPEQFKANADNGLAAINALFTSLDAEERDKAATVIREYQQFFIDLSQKQ